MSEEAEAAADAEMFPSPQRTAAPPRGIKRSSIKWPVVATTGVVVVLVLSTMATTWQRQHYGTSIQWSTRRSRAHSGVGSRARAAIESMGGEVRDKTLAAATEAREQLEQLTASIEQPMGAAGALGGGSGFAVDAAGRSTRRRGAASTQSTSAKQPGTCFAQQPWVPTALDAFFEHAWRSANASLQTSEEALVAINNVTWFDGYKPGHDEVTLRYDEASGRYIVDVKEISKPNLQYKKDCILEVLKGAVEAHNDELVQALRRRSLRFVVVTEDFGLVWRGLQWKLPTFALCTDDNLIDIPVPDFTFMCYPETRYTNSSWAAISDLLYRKSQMVSWGDRRNEIFHRSHWGVGPRQKLMPLFEAISNSSRDEATLGATLNVGDTGFSPHHFKRDNYVFLDAQCNHRYQIHTAGFSYSAGLKYKLACGSLVFKFESTYKEFYEPALQDGVHVVKVPEDPDKFESETLPRMRAAVTSTQTGDLPAVARGGQDFVMRNLTMDALHCYWYGALVRYSEIYFMEKTPAQKKAAEARTMAAGRGATMPVPEHL